MTDSAPFHLGTVTSGEDGGEGPPPPLGVSLLKDLLASEYMGPLSVGTVKGEPQAVLNVIFDTGSADLWIASDLCRKSPCTLKGRGIFDHKRSETFHFPAKNTSFTTAYGSGELSGSLGFDDVRVGPLIARGQMLGLIAEERGAAFTLLPIDGIAGLAFPALAADDHLSLVGNLAAQGSLTRRQFAFYLHRDTSMGGSMLWGGVDRRLYDGELHWFPVAEELYWALDLVAFQVGDRLFNTSQDRPGAHADRSAFHPPVATTRLIVDSGTTYYTAEGEIFQAIMERVRSIPCTQIGELPDLVYILRDEHGEDHRLAIAPEEYMVSSGDTLDICSPGIVNVAQLDDERLTMILGEVFMRRYFTVFSLDGRRGDADPSMSSAVNGRASSSSRIGFAHARFDSGAEAFLQEAAGLAKSAATPKEE